MTYATSADVAALLARELDTLETALVDRRLAQVERMILRRIPDLAAKIAAEEIDQDDVTDIEAEAVYRVVLHGDGIVSETDGNFSYQKSHSTDGTLRLTTEEWAVLGVTIKVGMTVIAPSINGLAL